MEIFDKGGKGQWIRRLGIKLKDTKIIVGEDSHP